MKKNSEIYHKYRDEICKECGRKTKHELVWDNKDISALVVCTQCMSVHRYGLLSLRNVYGKTTIKSRPEYATCTICDTEYISGLINGGVCWKCAMLNRDKSEDNE